jgi:hypothetical protein
MPENVKKAARGERDLTHSSSSVRMLSLLSSAIPHIWYVSPVRAAYIDFFKERESAGGRFQP